MSKLLDGGLRLGFKIRKPEEIYNSEIPAFFELLCPNCKMGILSPRLDKRYACVYCIPTVRNELKDPLELGRMLEQRGEIRDFKDISTLEKEVRDLNLFFKELIGSPLWSAQRVWAKRILSGQNIAIIAPTGVGKTVFGSIFALYLAQKKGKRSYIILPTTTLLRQVVEKIKNWEEKIGEEYAVYFHSKMTKKEKERMMQKLQNGDFKVLITTSQFLVKNIQIIYEAFKRTQKNPSDPPIDFMFVDDVDSFLRNPANVERAMLLLGYKRNRRLNEILNKIKIIGASPQYSAFLREEDWRIIEEIRKKSGQLVVSSATGRIGSATVRRIFTLIFGFSVGSSKEGIRNIVDTYDNRCIECNQEEILDRCVALIKKLGSGGLIFVARGEKSDEIIKSLEEKINEIGFKAKGVTAENSRIIKDVVEKFANKEINILIGKASAYGLLVRGLDLPEIIRYAIFIDVPHYAITLETKTSPTYLSFVIRKILPALKEKREAHDLLRKLSSHIIWLKPQEIKTIEEELNLKIDEQSVESIEKEINGKQENGSENHILAVKLITLKLYRILKNFLENNPIEELKKTKVPFILKKEGSKEKIQLLTADIKTYIQASGRTSRLYAGGVTKGLSIVLSDNKRLLDELSNKLLWTVDNQLVPLDEIDLDELLREIDKDREDVIKAREGKVPSKGHLETCLIVVESPTKAKTIASFFGRPSRRFLPGLVAYETIIGRYLATIVATVGHVTELITHVFIPIFGYIRENGRLKPIIKGFRVEELEWPFGVAIIEDDEKNQFVPIFGPRVTCKTCNYTFIPYIHLEKDKKLLEKTIKLLRDIREEANILDKRLLQLPLKCPRCGESENLYDRSVLINSLRKLAAENEMVIIGTDPDIEGEKIAWDIYLLLKPYARKIKRLEFHEVTKTAIEKGLENLRDIDELLVKGQLIRRIEDRWIGFHLSLKLRDLLDERNLSAGRVQSPVLKWIIDIYEKYKQKEEYTIIRIKDGLEIEIKGKIKPLKITVKDVNIQEKTIVPRPPLITDTLLLLSSNLLGLGANETMKLAQQLFESGLITYIRTDSTRVSPLGMYIGKRLIEKEFGSEFHVARSWSQKEGAHECIRPTRPLMLYELREAIERGEITLTNELSPAAFSLYDIITRFFIASQMKEAKITTVNYVLEVEYKTEDSKVEKSVVDVYGRLNIIEKGFLRALREDMYRFVLPKELPKLQKGQIIEGDKVEITVEKKSPVNLPTEGDIVRMMKERGIGRPSTYANIITKLKERKYVRVLRGSRLAPKTRGILVNKILEILNKDMVSEERTRLVLEQIDMVAEGKKDYREILSNIMLEIEDDLKKSARSYVWGVLPVELKEKIEKYKLSLYKRRHLYLLRRE